MRQAVALAFVSACGFTPGTLAVSGDATTIADDVTVPVDERGIDALVLLTDIAHVAAVDEPATAPTADVSWSGTVTINTMTLTVVPALPIGVALRTVAQESGGTPVAVLEVRSLVSTANVRITGDKPLIIFASQSIDIASGGLDIRASGAEAGAGARTAGAGVGLTGTHAGNYSDGGGGGGGFGAAGAAGGTATQSTNVGAAGLPGTAVGDATLMGLLGGSPGGPGQPANCTARARGGAGGGAIQLSATRITIGGSIIAGGGGGEGGALCPGNMASAGGGGSGGAIYLQALTLTGAGSLAANGGGGGAGSNWNGGPGQDGPPGTDATAIGVAGGGASVAPDGGAGGAGAASVAAMPGQSINSVYPNGGGGGGGGGRIYLDVPPMLTIGLTASPSAQRR